MFFFGVRTSQYWGAEGHFVSSPSDEDLNDHDLLRHDLMFGLAVGKLTGEANEAVRLAGKSTLNRLEQAMHVEGDLRKERYLKCSVQPGAIEQLMVAVALEEVGVEPRRMILDIDVTDDAVYGEQFGGFFNGYYGHHCYAPIIIFCGRHLLAAKLRSTGLMSLLSKDQTENSIAERLWNRIFRGRFKTQEIVDFSCAKRTKNQQSPEF